MGDNHVAISSREEIRKKVIMDMGSILPVKFALSCLIQFKLRKSSVMVSSMLVSLKPGFYTVKHVCTNLTHIVRSCLPLELAKRQMHEIHFH